MCVQIMGCLAFIQQPPDTYIHTHYIHIHIYIYIQTYILCTHTQISKFFMFGYTHTKNLTSSSPSKCIHMHIYIYNSSFSLFFVSYLCSSDVYQKARSSYILIHICSLSKVSIVCLYIFIQASSSYGFQGPATYIYIFIYILTAKF